MLNARFTQLAALGAVAVLLGGCTLLADNANVTNDGNSNAGTNQAAGNEEGNAAMNANTNSNASANTNANTNTGAAVNVNTGGAMMEEGKTREFTVKGMNFAYDVKEIKVKKGDKVKITFVNVEGFHDWVLDEFSVKTPQINGGQTAVVEFTASKTGTFEYYCSVGKHRQMGMVGKLIVE